MSRPTFLQGCRIVDLSMGWAGPLATRHLGDMGAEIIKVESCVRFDWFRGWESSQRWIDNNEAEKHEPFNALNRNKFDVTLDLSNPRGRDLLLRLVAISDAVIENYAGEVLPKLHLGFEVFKAVKPDIVMVSMPGFGSSGPWSKYRAYGSTTEQAAGLPHLSGHPEHPPTMVHIALGDAVAGLNGASAMLVALRHLKRTGEGQFVDLSHSECLLPLAAHGIAEQTLAGAPPPRLGNRSRHCAPHGVYRCGDGRWLVIQVRCESQWEGLCSVLGDAVAGFDGLEDRLARSEELDTAVSEWCVRQGAAEAMDLLQSAGVPAAAVIESKELMASPQLQARRFWEILDRPYIGKHPNGVAPYQLQDGPLEIGWPAPTLGQHNREVLGGLLGLSEADLADLERDGIIGNRPRLPGAVGG